MQPRLAEQPAGLIISEKRSPGRSFRSRSDPLQIFARRFGSYTLESLPCHAGEVHTFHIHQIHFLFLEVNGRKLPSPEWRDTVILPAWDGAGPYPTVKLRLDFRDPSIAGVFPFHCHILDHEDAGMMATVQVNPK